nr:DUF2380 domain-containing protein [uncultured Methylophaga sp.]
MRFKKFFLVISLLLGLFVYNFTHAQTSDPPRVLLLNFELRGDDTVQSLQEHDAEVIETSDQYLQQTLNNGTSFEVIDTPESQALLAEARQKFNLERCNGCEFDLAEKVDARYVVVPWVFRMSVLIQTLYIEVRDVKTQNTVLRVVRDYRGNTEKAWQRAIDSAVLEINESYQ